MLRCLLLLSLLAVVPLAHAESGDDDSVEHTLGNDRFAAGHAVNLSGSIAGDAFAAGGRVTLDGPVAGDAFLAGAHVEVRGPISQGLYAAGGFVIVSSSVTRNARLAGGTIEVTPGAHLGGSVSMVGRTMTMAGTTDGYLQMAGRDATVSGSVGGDLEVSAERIEIGPQAKIAGKLRYRSEREPVVAAGAQIVGGLERLPGSYRAWTWREGAHHAMHGVGRGLWFSGSLVLGLLLLLLAPGFLARTSQVAATEWPLCLGTGFAVLIAVPIATVLLLITLIGIPIALLSIALYAVALMLGHIVGAVALGDFALGRLAPARVGAAGWRMVGYLAALATLVIVRYVPLVGGLATLCVFLIGIGALSLYVVRPKPPASTAAPTAPAAAAA